MLRASSNKIKNALPRFTFQIWQFPHYAESGNPNWIELDLKTTNEVFHTASILRRYALIRSIQRSSRIYIFLLFDYKSSLRSGATPTEESYEGLM